MDIIATSSTWKNIPIDRPKRIDIQLHFTNEEFLKLSKGLIPQQMEDKWFVYYHNEWIYFHRSWTGCGIYKAQIFKENESYLIKDFWVERNFTNYQRINDFIDMRTFSELIADRLLGVDVQRIQGKKKKKQ